ncbi:MAG: WecB/TagA/CpsF family glycosyltransferase [Planctomycetes bacterium]|nr:WecB/TagA/CpsF family glycosyltransferase [Planctomycetota bacterium]
MEPVTDRIDLLGVAIDNVSMAEAIDRIVELAHTRRGAYVVTPNVDHLVKLQHHKAFREVYEHADLVLADGMPLIWASRLLGSPLKEKVSGSDLFVKFAGRAAREGLRLFFLGGREGAAEAAAGVLRARHPELQVVGTYCPYFGFQDDPAENARIAATVREADPHVLFVGLGAPKQELWIYQNREALAVPVSIGVGVSFEFAAGLVRRAPRPLQKLGLEWGWRLAMEPRRLWKRYLVEDRDFFRLLWKQYVTMHRERLRRRRAR